MTTPPLRGTPPMEGNDRWWLGGSDQENNGAKLELGHEGNLGTRGNPCVLWSAVASEVRHRFR
jgi:hypothetical protein